MATGNLGQGIRTLRVVFTGWPQGKAAALAEIAVGGGQDIKFNAGQLGGTIIGTPGSWGNNPNATKEAALDGNVQTFFDADIGDGAWVGLDLGTGKRAMLSKIRFRPRPESDANSRFAGRMVGGRFQIANQPDWSDASTVFTVTVPPVSSQFTEIELASPFAGRYVRYLSPQEVVGMSARLSSIASKNPHHTLFQFHYENSYFYAITLYKKPHKLWDGMSHCVSSSRSFAPEGRRVLAVGSVCHRNRKNDSPEKYPTFWSAVVFCV